MYSQHWNCAASLFPKQNYNVLSPNFHIRVSVSDLYIFQDQSTYFSAAKEADWSWEYINCWQVHECRNWERGHAVSFLGIHKSDFQHSAEAKLMFFFFHVIPTQRAHIYYLGIFVTQPVLPWRGAWCRPSTWPSTPSAPPAEPCPVQATQSVCHNAHCPFFSLCKTCVFKGRW
jgi:hypothetical protein